MSAPDKNYASVRNAAAIVTALAGAVPDGLGNKDIAAACAITPAQVTRLCAPLIEVGWVRKLTTGNYCIRAEFASLLLRVTASFNTAEQRLEDLRRSFLDR